MSTLSETLMKSSRVAAFIIESLALKSYPNCLFWKDEDKLTFCLLCPHRKKESWSQEVQNVFLDYNTFKVRKSVAADKDKRSVFLQALKASPYIHILKKLSTADKKICIFTNKFKELINSRLESFSLPGQLAKSTSASTDNPIEVSTLQAVDNYMEKFMFLGSPSLESNHQAAHSLENSVSCNGSLPAGNNTVAEIEYQDSSLVSNILEQAFSIPMETVSALPSTVLPETDNIQPSLYGTYNESTSFVENPQPPYNDSWSNVDLNETQLSPSFFMDEVELPADCDPVKELICSQQPPQAVNQVVLCNRAQTSNCEILSIHGLEYVGNRVHILDQVDLNSTFDLDSPKYYMVKIKDTTQQQ